MKIKAIHIQIILFIIAVIFISKTTSAFTASKIITTDHFIINYNFSNSSCAIALAVKLESYNEIIASFFEIDPLDKAIVFLSDEINAGLISEKNDIESNELIVHTDGNFNLIDNDLYKKIFFIYLRKTMNKGKGTSLLDENFVNAILQYPKTDYKFIEIIRSDLSTTIQNSLIDFKKIENYNRKEQMAIYTVLIDFTISVYGKNSFIQSLKDTDYYGGFYEALSGITGDSITLISEKYNTFLQKSRTDLSDKSQKIIQLIHGSDEFSDISYSVSENEYIAVLEKNRDKFRLLLKSGDNETRIMLKHTENGSFFSYLVFIDNDQVAIIEMLESGSTVHIYDTKNMIFIRNFFFPFLFIADINSFKNGNLIFSAKCGLASDIYTFNMNTYEFNIITETGNYYSPLLLKNQVYCILNNKDKNSIVELDTLSGEVKTLFSTEQKISFLKRASGSSLTFTLENNGLYNIFLLDLQSGNLLQIIKNNTSNMISQVTSKYIYYFSFYESRYQLFFKQYAPDDI